VSINGTPGMSRKYFLPEAPDVPLTIQSDKSLTLFQFRTTTSTVVGIKFFRACRLLEYLVELLLCGSFRWTSLMLLLYLLLLCHSLLLNWTPTDALLAQDFLSSVCDLLENRFLLRKTFVKYAKWCNRISRVHVLDDRKVSNCSSHYLASRLKGLNAFGARKALLMVCVAHGRHDFSLNVVLADGTFSSKRLLIVGDTVVAVIFWEEPPDCERFITLNALKTAFVEVFVGDPQNLAGTLFLAFRAVDFRFTCGFKCQCDGLNVMSDRRVGGGEKEQQSRSIIAVAFKIRWLG
jgi:hypothetical protein